MILSNKTLEKLRLLINEETEYRSGPKLVAFFNQFGFSDVYGYSGGFPSRSKYTDDKLNKINGTPEIDKCIKSLFAPINYIGKYTELDNFIFEFNQYLAFDKWRVVRKNSEIQIIRADDIDIDKAKLQEKVAEDIKESEFLQKEFGKIEIDKLPIDSTLIPILDLRLNEIKNCIESKAFLASIILMGSTLEGILLGIASANAASFNQALSAPKDKNTDNVFPFSKWNLNNYIDVAYEIGYIHLDVKKFSHGLREFRNYIHPYQQLTEKFTPNEQTATICYQVLKAAIVQIISYK